jgi:hypothetical protein
MTFSNLCLDKLISGAYVYNGTSCIFYETLRLDLDVNKVFLVSYVGFDLFLH